MSAVFQRTALMRRIARMKTRASPGLSQNPIQRRTQKTRRRIRTWTPMTRIFRLVYASKKLKRIGLCSFDGSAGIWQQTDRVIKSLIKHVLESPVKPSFLVSFRKLSGSSLITRYNICQILFNT